MPTLNQFIPSIKSIENGTSNSIGQARRHIGSMVASPFQIFFTVALKWPSMKTRCSEERQLMFKTYFEIAKVGTSCCQEMDLGLNPKIGSDGGHSQLFNAPLDAFGFSVYQRSYLVPAKKVCWMGAHGRP